MCVMIFKKKTLFFFYFLQIMYGPTYTNISQILFYTLNVQGQHVYY